VLRFAFYFSAKYLMKKRVTKILFGFRLDPHLRDLAVESAAHEHRSLSNYIELLIRKDVEARGLLLPQVNRQDISAGKPRPDTSGVVRMAMRD
jgi:hypothetical protein